MSRSPLAPRLRRSPGPLQPRVQRVARRRRAVGADRKSTRLNSSHSQISYAVFCLKKKYIITIQIIQDFPASIPHIKITILDRDFSFVSQESLTNLIKS